MNADLADPEAEPLVRFGASLTQTKQKNLNADYVDPEAEPSVRFGASLTQTM